MLLRSRPLKPDTNKEYLVKTGLTLEGDNGYPADRFRGRVMFPVHSFGKAWLPLVVVFWKKGWQNGEVR